MTSGPWFLSVQNGLAEVLGAQRENRREPSPADSEDSILISALRGPKVGVHLTVPRRLQVGIHLPIQRKALRFLVALLECT